MSYDPEERRDTPLALKLKERIRREGPISILDYMQRCLQDPEHGYYVKQRAIGATGDFITAPEISQVFGELIGLWCVVVWQQMGSPSKVNLVELGPGRGTLMRDVLHVTRKIPGFRHAISVHLVESNHTLRALQRAACKAFEGPTAWHSECDALTAEPSIVVANEFLDSCPAAQIEFDPEGMFHRGVGLDGNQQLQFMRIPDPMKTDPQLFEVLPHLSPGSIVESQDFSFFLSLRCALKTAQFSGLFIDYGHFQEKTGESLQAVRNHRVEHPLCSPGEADLSVDVDFSAFTHFANDDLPMGLAPALTVDGPVTQAEFLGSLGIMERASNLMAMNPAKAGEIEASVARLMAPSGMGTRFKAIGLRSPDLPKLPGFA